MGIIMKNKVCYSNGGNTTIQPVIYSDTEREIGVWRDGKPLYQITKVYQNVSISTSSYAILESAWGMELVHAFGFLEESGNRYSIPETSIRIEVEDSSGDIICTSKTSSWNGDFYITFQYTKPTDTPGSGTWTPSVIPAVHYSTDEQIVGTWIDGKTLYQKTIDCGNLPDSNTKNVPHLISGITPSDIVDISGVGQYAGHYTTPLPKVHDGSINSQVMIEVDDTNIILYSRNGNNASYVGYITLRYTKSSS